MPEGQQEDIIHIFSPEKDPAEAHKLEGDEDGYYPAYSSPVKIDSKNKIPYPVKNQTNAMQCAPYNKSQGSTMPQPAN
jgi:hypothetical protein